MQAPDPNACPLSGTSIAMIKKHYGQLICGDAEEGLASIAIWEENCHRVMKIIGVSLADPPRCYVATQPLAARYQLLRRAAE